MSDDTISRQAAINVADAIWSVTGDKNVAKVWYQIKDLPSAQPEPRWIPVTERLPEEAGEYLVTVINLVAETKSELIDIALWNDKIEENRGFLKADEVTAWMPLPKPYERSEEKTEKEENEA